MRTLSIDLGSDVPVYKQIAGEMRALITRGSYGEGDELPSMRVLGDRIGVNLNTVAKAYRLLEDEGLIVLRHGAAARVQRHVTSKTRAPDADSLRQLRDVLGRWASVGLSRKAVEAQVAQTLDALFDKTRSSL